MTAQLSGYSGRPVVRDRTALGLFELFLFSGVATVLVTRAYLAAMGYPQVGGGSLHVAHVLWGGLLMAVAIVALVIVPGSRVKPRAALVGGIGFGLFIDEIGKFVSADVDYFFQPAIALMYVVFVALYLAVVVILRRRALTDQLRVHSGLAALGDQVLGQLGEERREVVLRMLDEVADPSLRPVADVARAALAAHTAPDTGIERRITKWRDAVGGRARRALGGQAARRVVIGLFALEAVLAAAGAIVALVMGEPGGEGIADTAAQYSGLVSAALVFAGLFHLLRPGGYLTALRFLRAAIIVNLLITQVFVFASEQFGALVGFTLSLLMLMVLRLAIRDAEREGRAAPPEASPLEDATPAAGTA